MNGRLSGLARERSIDRYQDGLSWCIGRSIAYRWSERYDQRRLRIRNDTTPTDSQVNYRLRPTSVPQILEVPMKPSRLLYHYLRGRRSESD